MRERGEYTVMLTVRAQRGTPSAPHGSPSSSSPLFSRRRRLRTDPLTLPNSRRIMWDQKDRVATLLRFQRTISVRIGCQFLWAGRSFLCPARPRQSNVPVVFG